MSLRFSTLVVLFSFVAVGAPGHSQVRGKIELATIEMSHRTPIITAIATKDHVSLTALALTQRMRLEVVSQAGDTVYDSDLHPGNRLQWEVRDQHGSELPEGVYGCIVTVEELDGRVSHRRGIFRITQGAVSFHTAGREVVAASDEQETLSILRADESSAITIVAHDGQEGWIETARGGLNLYAGSASRGDDTVPHLRLTPEGSLGIGVADPAAKLDVAGVIRASEGFQFSDGTVLKMEGGYPVLVMDSSSHTSGVTSDSAGSTDGKIARTVRLQGTRSGIIPFALTNGSPTPMYANEVGSNTWFGESAGVSVTTGTNNSFFGINAGTATTTGYYNSFFGSDAGNYNTAGSDNSFFGFGAGRLNTTGNHNSFVGSGAGYSNSEGSKNSFFGYQAGNYNTTGFENSFFGFAAGNVNSTGYYNSFFGSGAGSTNGEGNANSFFGYLTGNSNTTGSENSFFGRDAGRLNTTGYYNSFVGSGAGYSNSEGNANSFFGYLAGNYNTTGSFNSFFGTDAGYTNTAGSENSFFGWKAGRLNTTGYYNSFVGSGAGYSNSEGNANSFFGYLAGNYNTTGSFNSFAGTDAGMYNTTGYENSFFGFRAGRLNTTGYHNSFVGAGAGFGNSTGNANSFIGFHAGASNSTGSSNSFIGHQAGYSNLAGAFNSFLGYRAGYNNTTGDLNSFFGNDAGLANTTGGSNSFLGTNAGMSNTSGYNNLFLGTLAGQTNTIENENSCIGALSDGAVGITNATAVGFRAKVTQSNSLVLGSIKGVNGATNNTNVGIGVTAPAYRLHVESPFTSNVYGGRAAAAYTLFNPTSNADGYIFGLESNARFQGSVALTASHTSSPVYALSALTGYYGGTVSTGVAGGSVGTVSGVTAQNVMRNGITVADAIGVHIQPASADVGSAAVANVYGVYVKNPFNVAPSNVYGLYVDNLTVGTNRYAVYTAGAAKSYFGGDVQVAGNLLYGVGDQIPPDYVFEPGYKLMPIEDLAAFLAREKHLPSVPSAAEIKVNGLRLSEFQMKLLEKIEELTLYTVQQAETIRKLQSRVADLERVRRFPVHSQVE